MIIVILGDIVFNLKWIYPTYDIKDYISRAYSAFYNEPFPTSEMLYLFCSYLDNGWKNTNSNTLSPTLQNFSKYLVHYKNLYNIIILLNAERYEEYDYLRKNEENVIYIRIIDKPSNSWSYLNTKPSYNILEKDVEKILKEIQEKSGLSWEKKEKNLEDLIE